MASLRFLNGPRANETYRLTGKTTTFGRKPDCDLVLPSHTVSRRHAQIVRLGSRFFIEDLDSRNGTYLNQAQLKESKRLSDHDWIGIDDALFEFIEFEESATADEPDGNNRNTLFSEQVSVGETKLEFAERVTSIDVSATDSVEFRASAHVRLQAVLEITRALGACSDASQILPRVVDSVCQAFPSAGQVCLLEVEPDTGRIQPVCRHQRDAAGDAAATFAPICPGTVRHVVHRQEAVIRNGQPIGDAESASALEDDAPVSLMCAPLVGASRKTVGVICVEAEQSEYTFRSEDLDLLMCIAVLAANSLEQARNHDARYRAVVDTAADGIITLNAAGKIESVNPAVERLFGYEGRELEGQDVTRLFAGSGGNSDPPSTLQAIARENKKHAARMREFAGRRRDGSSFPLEVSLAEFTYDEKEHFTLICHDVTERTRAEQALRDSQQRLSRMVETGVVGIAFGTSSGEILDANDAFFELTGYSRDEVRSTPVTWRQMTAPEYASDDERAVAELRRTGRFGPYEKEYVRKDGRRLPVSLSIAALPGADDEHVAFIVDNSQRKRAESELRALNASLEQRVRERTVHLRLLQEAAVIANEAPSVTEACRATLKALCRQMQWATGRVVLQSHRKKEKLLQVAAYPEPSECSGVEFKSTSRLRQKVFSTGHAAWSPRANASPRDPAPGTDCEGGVSIVAFPILVGNAVCGTLEFTQTTSDPPTDEVLRVMTNVGAQLGRVVERRRLQRELVDAVWQQQQTIGQEIHDTFGQELTGIRMLADSLRWKLEASHAAEAAKAAELSQLIEQAQQASRRIARGLFPVEVFEHGLMAALDELARRVTTNCGTQCDFRCPQPVDVKGNDLATHLFRIAQEATNNSVKHGRAEHIEIALWASRSTLHLQIADDGVGIEESARQVSDGMGLRVMDYRIRILGGSLSLKRNQPQGTIVRCRVAQGRDDED